MQAAFSTSRTGCRAATTTVLRQSARAGRRPAEPRRWWIALAMLALPPVGAPAAAQSGSEAVVCVGSERRILVTNPIRRVYTEDMEIVYRIGVDIGQRDQVERNLSSDLGSYPEVVCAWSDPGDDHAVIISYTGVIRQDLTVDPEDPRFQAFSVGFGADFDAAETQATTINQRFSSRYDGNGYEVLLRESWGVAEEVAAAAEEPEFTPPDGPICTGRASPEGCWMEISNHPGCFLWNPQPRQGAAVSWSGECSNGFAEGRGEERWQWNDGGVTGTGVFQDGRREGFHVIIWGRAGDDNVVREEGSYLNDERHGTWTGYDASGNVVGTIRFENGRLIGRFENPVALNRSFSRHSQSHRRVAHSAARETDSTRGNSMIDQLAHPGSAVRYKVN